MDLELSPEHRAHAVGYCTACGAPAVVAVSKATKTGRGNSERTSWPSCRRHPKCPGHHLPRRHEVEAGNDRAWNVPAPHTTPPPPPKSHVMVDGGGRVWKVDPQNGHRTLALEGPTLPPPLDPPPDPPPSPLGSDGVAGG